MSATMVDISADKWFFRTGCPNRKEDTEKSFFSIGCPNVEVDISV